MPRFKVWYTVCKYVTLPNQTWNMLIFWKIMQWFFPYISLVNSSLNKFLTLGTNECLVLLECRAVCLFLWIPVHRSLNCLPQSCALFILYHQKVQLGISLHQVWTIKAILILSSSWEVSKLPAYLDVSRNSELWCPVSPKWAVHSYCVMRINQLSCGLSLTFSQF